MDFGWGVALGTILGVLLMQAITWLMSRRGSQQNARAPNENPETRAGTDNGDKAAGNADDSELNEAREDASGDLPAGLPNLIKPGASPSKASATRGRTFSSSVRSPSMSSLDSWAPTGSFRSNGNGLTQGALGTGGSAAGASDEAGDDDYEEESEGRHSSVPHVDAAVAPANAPSFPFINIRNLIEGTEPKNFYPNLRGGPQEFRSEHASGKAILALRIKEHEDPEFASYFEGKQRRFQLKFQVTFSKAPRGTLYLGGAVPGDMQLGVVTKGLCRGILSILKKVSSGMHYSFGKHLSAKDDHKELPHISFPVFVGATALHVTKAGEEIPDIEREIEETPEQIKARKKQGQVPLHAGDTLTFEVHSMYIDVVQWKVTNLGALGNMDLSLFWDTMPLHLVLYDAPEDAKHHYEDEKRSFFGLCIENTWFAREDGQPPVIYPEDREDVAPNGTGARSGARSRPAKTPMARVNSVGIYVGSESGAEGDQELVEEDEDAVSRDSRENTADDELSLQRTPSGSEIRSSLRDLTTRDLIVLAWLEHAGHKRKNLSFVLSRSDGTLLFLQQRENFGKLQGFAKHCEADLTKRPRKTWEWETLREQLDKALAVAPATPVSPGWVRTKYKLLSAQRCEDLHVSVSSKYSDGSRFSVLWESPVLRPLWETKWHEEWAILTRSRTRGDLYLLLFSCHCKSPTVVLSAAKVLEVRQVTTAAVVPFASYFPCLEIHTKGRVVLLGFPNQEKRTAFQDLLADAAQRERDDGNANGSGSSDEAESLLTSDMTTNSLSYEASRWGSQKRMIINCRRLHFNNDFSRRLSSPQTGASDTGASPGSPSSGCFRGAGASQAVASDPNVPAWSGRRYSELGANAVVSARPHGRLASLESSDPVSSVYEQDLLDARAHLEQKWPLKPWELSSILLRTALSLHDSSTLEDQVRFFDQASQLRELNIYGWSRVMTHEETTCFALNLYHALRLHAKYLVGQPSSLLGWASFGSRVSYAIGAGPSGQAMVLSLAEIEHCILRKPMSLARTMVSTTYPASRFTRLLELRTAEPRINLVINYGTRSTSPNIVVFNSPSQLDKLLDAASADFLREQLKIDSAKHIIGVPKLLYWYGKDFAARAKMRDFSTRSIGLEVIEYCAEDQRQLVDRLLRHPETTFRVRTFKWRAQGRQSELVP